MADSHSPESKQFQIELLKIQHFGNRSIDNSDCFTELSETDQESLAGGYDLASGFDFLIFQDTEIDTFGKSQTNISDNADLNVSSTTSTGYSFRQTTLVLAFSRLGGGTCQKNPLAMLFGLLQQFGLGDKL